MGLTNLAPSNAFIKLSRLTMLIILLFIMPTMVSFPQSVPVIAAFDGTVAYGNQHVFFLPPIAPNPSFSGVLDTSLEPIIEVCELDNDLCLFPPIVQFPFGGSGVSLNGNHYQLNFKPKQYDLDPDMYYQIRILVGDLVMGFVSVSGDLGNGTIPIKFRLEEGCTDWGIVGPDGGAFSFDNDIIFNLPTNALDENIAIGILPLPTSELQALLDARPYMSSEKNVLGGFKALPDGLTFNVPVTVAMPVLPTTQVPVQVKLSEDTSSYWITPTTLIYDPETSIAEFTLTSFCGNATVEVAGADVVLPDDCAEKRIEVVVESNDFSDGQGCQIVGEYVQVKFLDCPGQPTQSVHISETTPECGENFELAVNLEPITVNVCRSEQLEATVVDQNGNDWTLPLTWISYDPQIAKVNMDGEVTGITEGVVKIEVRTPDVRYKHHAYITVDQCPPINIEAHTPPFFVGDEIQFMATNENNEPYHCEYQDDNGVIILQPVTWTSLNPDIISIPNPSIGLGYANEFGIATIKAESLQAVGTKTLSIDDIVVYDPCDSDLDKEIFLEPFPWDHWEEGILPGETLQLIANVRERGYDPSTGEYQFEWLLSECIGDLNWYSYDTDVVTVSETGLITAVNPGTAIIRVEMTDYPWIYGEELFSVWHTLCDKDGDMKLDYDMREWSCWCDVSAHFNYNLLVWEWEHEFWEWVYSFHQDCLDCIGFQENYCCPSDPWLLGSQKIIQKCKTGEIRTSGCQMWGDFPPYLWAYWGYQTPISCDSDKLNINPQNSSDTASTLKSKNISENSIQEADARIIIKPNPVRDVVTISTSEIGKYQITVSAMSGYRVIDKEFYEEEYSIDMSSFPQGSYILMIRSTNFIMVEKIIKL